MRDAGTCDGARDIPCANIDNCETDSTSDCCRCRARFKWTDGHEVTYQNWADTEPHGSSGAECGWLVPTYGNPRVYQFGDGGCKARTGYICKKSSEL